MPAVVTLTVLPLYVVWALVLATGGGDLAAQLAWAGFASRHPGSAYNLSWYGGAHTANYSLLTPWLMAAFGVRTVSVVAGVSSTWLMALLFVRAEGARGGRLGGDGPWRGVWPALLAAAALWCNVVSGRTTFAVGIAFALAACLVAQGPVGATAAPIESAALGSVRRSITRLSLASVSTALATMASPVAGLFLLVVGAAYGLDRQWRKAAVLSVPPCVIVTATTLLFPFEGEQPMAVGKLWMPLGVCAALLVAAPPSRTWRVVRAGAAVYAVGVVLTYVVASPIGSNVERLVGLAGPPVLLAALLAPGLDRTRRVVLAVVLLISVNWLRDKTLDDTGVSTVTPAWASHTDGLVDELRRLGADRTRVEVVPARNHREAAVLGAYVNNARGWNRQLDVERGRLFYDGSFSAGAYRAWLDRWAVGLVAVHDGLPDGPATAEAALVRSGVPWLERVWGDAHWTVYRVRGAVPLVSAPGVVVRGDDAALVVRMSRAGSATVRVAYSPWLRAEGACVARDGEWTRLTVRRPGVYRLDSPYRWPRGGGC
ncbi:hypothetical protein [Streptomyces sp. BPTC-684]|uniref:hypothetical protein n=1 Tax=Streptomyces sp. BPTC-684 TaxID=3043734 RepID=UPI0024B0E090|nr:hypothetical protein [Streptomyces sp. BPTC-684]WHM41253.1 hypothetical protein QIY60_08635 [Streptomyces sp. BPTC-684]